MNRAINISNRKSCYIFQLWITRIAAASREHGMTYPALIHNLIKVSYDTYCSTLSQVL